ncbi:MAG: ATP-binding protein [Algicola sp.]|nr:ATP-binding protein [Algicola sp.]
MNKDLLLEQDLGWLEACIEHRVNQFIEPKIGPEAPPVAPQLNDQQSGYYPDFIKKHALDETQRKIVLMALAPDLKPQVFDGFLVKNSHTERGFSEFGGYHLGSFTGFIPDMRTALFVLAGGDLHEQLNLHSLFDNSSPLLTQDILMGQDDKNVPRTHQKLRLSESALAQILSGKNAADPGADFPARLLTTSLDWSDLVLPDSTRAQLKELRCWIKMKSNGRLDSHLAQGQDKLLAQDFFKGYRCLFYGPSGTGKTLTASLIGKAVGLPVYRVDPPQLISKYIGETEKNLESVFKEAERQNWLLFFDEADALFNQRTSVSNSNDRSANQQVAFLLQRLESCSTLVILATNLKENLDPAFVRRFQSVVHFPEPEPKDRAKLWQNLFAGGWSLDPDIDLDDFAQRFDLTAGAMNNVLRYCTLMAMENNSNDISRGLLIEGIRREYAKQHRSIVIKEIERA